MTDERKALIYNGFYKLKSPVFDLGLRVYEFAAGMCLKKSEVAQLGKHE